MTTTYTPPAALPGSPLAGTDDFWSTSLWENHEALYVQHAPPIVQQARAMSDGNVSRSWYRWRLRGNLDLHPMRWRGYLTPSGGTPTVTVYCGTASTTSNVTGTGWLDVDVTPVAGGVQDCLLVADATGVGVSLALDGALVRLVPSTRTTKQPSGWIGDDEVTDTANWPVNIEHLDRLERGPLFLARDRPHCIVAIAPKIATSWGPKSITDWLGGNTTDTAIVGHALLPRVDDRPRRYIVDAFVAQDGAGTCTPSLRIGSWQWQIPTTGAWHSAEVVLPPGPLPIVASVTADVGVRAQFQGVQVWRL